MKLNFYKLLMLIVYISLYSVSSYATGKEGFQELLLTFTINKVKNQEVEYTLVTHDGQIYMLATDLDKHQMKRSYYESQLTTIEGQEYVNINKLKDAKVTLSLEELSATLDYPLHETLPQLLDAKSRFGIRTLEPESGDGAFISYNATLTKTHEDYVFSTLPELHLFNNTGTLVSNFIATRSFAGHNRKSVFKRLETAWTTEHMENMSQIKLGDSITKASDWSGSSRFVGVQYANNFAIRPDLVTHPLANFLGTASLPSTVDIYSGSTLLSSKQVKPGEFEIANLPITTGRGDLIVQTKDITGEIQTIVLPFYIAPSMLKGGLSDYSFSAGKRRKNYGIRSSGYDYFITSGDYLYGKTDYWTTGFHWEGIRDRYSFGVNNNLQIGKFGLVSSSLGTGVNSLKNSQYYAVGYSYQGKVINVGARQSYTSKNFTNIGSSFTGNPALSNRNFQINGGFNYENFGSFNTNYTRSRSSGQEQLKILTLSYDQQVYDANLIRLSASRSYQGRVRSESYLISLVLNFGPRNININRSSNSNLITTDLSVSSVITKTTDWGYRVYASKQKKHHNYDVELRGQNQYASGSFRSFNYGKSQSQILNASGSAVFMNDDIFLTQQISNSFALIKVGEMSNVPVYVNNNLVGKTNSKGNVLAPNVNPYITSEVRVDLKDIPLNVKVPKTKDYVAPKNLSGVIAKFEAEAVKSVSMKLLDSSSKPLPVNSVVSIDGIQGDLYVGYDGEVFIEDIGMLNTLEGKVCVKGSCASFVKSLNSELLQQDFIDGGAVTCDGVIIDEQ